MLYADKRNLELNLQVALLGIRNKELHFYTENLIAIGTQAALLSALRTAASSCPSLRRTPTNI